MTGYDIREVLPGGVPDSGAFGGKSTQRVKQLSVPGQQGGKARNLLVDTGFRTEGCKKALLKGLEQLGVSMEDTDILLTHLHADHSGNARS